MAITKFSDSNYSPLYKRVWGGYANNLYGNGGDDPFMAAIEKDFTKLKGSQMDFPINTTFGGSVGAGVLPTANTAKKVTVTLTRKRLYARLNLDRETIEASKGREGAFKEATQDETKAKLDSFMRMCTMWLYNDGTGILGQFSATPGGTASAPTIVILNTGTYRFRQAFFEEGDYINVRAAGTTLLSSVWEITAVALSTRTLTLALISGPDNLITAASGTSDVILANSLNACPMGVKGAIEAASTLYGVTIERRFQSYRVNASSADISIDYFNDLAINVDNLSGKPPTHYGLSKKQMLRFLNRMGDIVKPVDIVSSGNKLAKVRVSHPGYEFNGPGGNAVIFSSRYIHDDSVLALNLDECKSYHLGQPKWLDLDGTVLLRMTDLDAYEARYGALVENYFNPLFFGEVYGLATS